MCGARMCSARSMLLSFFLRSCLSSFQDMGAFKWNSIFGLFPLAVCWRECITKVVF